MNFSHILEAAGAFFLLVLTALFKKGGIYNPIEEPISVPAIEPQPIPTPTMPSITLVQLCTALRDCEGVPGDANYRNNNPINAKYYYDGYLPMYGVVGKSPGGFAVFRDYATGFTYACNMIKNKIAHHPTWTLLDLVHDHAPPVENDTVRYVKRMCLILKVPADYLMRNVV